MKQKYLSLLVAVGLLSGCAAATVVNEPNGDMRTGTPIVAPALKQQLESRTLKRKVAIARFSNETKYGNNFLMDNYGDRVGKQASDILAARLTETNKFIMLERADFNRVQDEVEHGRIAAINVPADYLIIGSVSEFGRKDTSEVGVFSRSKKQTAYAKVNIRLVDTKTGQVVFGTEGSGEAASEVGSTLGVGSRAGYDATLDDKAISAAITKMIGNVIDKLLDKPWRSYVLSFTNGQYIIAGGKAQGIKVNDEFAVYKKGQVIANPQTGLPIELPGVSLGKIKVVTTLGSTVDDEVSLCVPASGAQLPDRDFDKLYISQ
ncbi:hypothetical protein GMST_33450 [Geomonas silvestris]|uniref:Curli production assembly protein CsgG n=1 Tax=Geomonas silvestris TaxID=2740184 RepID=A0A6V8MLX2_9BACT|nr:CsgG/HfaB family protein [Geomonas silvestris]GFO61020.1 hypothetical protein GMST_33450 [Geomonas silvestris]